MRKQDSRETMKKQRYAWPLVWWLEIGERLLSKTLNAWVTKSTKMTQLGKYINL
jgi:hypothetical protein